MVRMLKRLKKLIMGERVIYPEINRNEKPDAIILAAGMLGKEKLFPKALYEYAGKTSIEHQINWLKPFVGKIIIACHQNEFKQIFGHLGNLENVEYSLETVLLGTAGAVKRALEKTNSKSFIICNVDDLTDIDLNALISLGPDTVCVANPRLNFGVMEIEGFDVIQFREKPLLKNIWASCGVYFICKKTAVGLPERGSLEHDVWPNTDKLKGFKHFGVWKTFFR